MPWPYGCGSRVCNTMQVLSFARACTTLCSVIRRTTGASCTRTLIATCRGTAICAALRSRCTSWPAKHGACLWRCGAPALSQRLMCGRVSVPVPPRSHPPATRRLLRSGKRCLMGIGDNREHCFILPVSFAVLRVYVQEGFVLEELVRTRPWQLQRNSARAQPDDRARQRLSVTPCHHPGALTRRHVACGTRGGGHGRRHRSSNGSGVALGRRAERPCRSCTTF